MKTPPYTRSCTKHELFLELKRICDEFNKNKEKKTKINLGFDELHLPDKLWLASALFDLEPKNDFFCQDKHFINKELLQNCQKSS